MLFKPLGVYLLSFLFASTVTSTATAQDLRDPYCDPGYRYVGADIFGVDIQGSFFGRLHGGDSVFDVVCHLQNTPGVTVEIETPPSDTPHSFKLPDGKDYGALNGLTFDGTSSPIVKFYNYRMDGVSLDGEVRFRTATSAEDHDLLALAHMRLEQERRLSVVQPGHGVLADSIDSIYITSAKPSGEAETKQFLKDRNRVAWMMLAMMEMRSIPVLQDLSNQGSVWFEPTNGVTSSIEGRVKHGVEIYITYDVEKDDTRLMRRFLGMFYDMMSQARTP